MFHFKEKFLALRKFTYKKDSRHAKHFQPFWDVNLFKKLSNQVLESQTLLLVSPHSNNNKNQPLTNFKLSSQIESLWIPFNQSFIGFFLLLHFIRNFFTPISSLKLSNLSRASTSVVWHVSLKVPFKQTHKKENFARNISKNGSKLNAIYKKLGAIYIRIEIAV